MRVQCAWCKKWGPDKAPLSDPSVSHGICPKCAKDFEKKNPGQTVLKWSMYAGGTSAAEGKHGYDATFPQGKYSIQPVSTSSGRHRGYSTHFINDRGALVGGLWQNLGLFRSPNEAKRKCLEHYQLNFAHSNPGESWHAGKMEEAERSERNVKKPSLKDFYHGKAIAHFESALEERARTKTRKNPLAVFGLGNPPNRISAKVAGIIYRRCVEVKAEKLGKFQKGFWRHPFDAASQVHVLALDNGDILLHSVAGTRLWEKA